MTKRDDIGRFYQGGTIYRCRISRMRFYYGATADIAIVRAVRAARRRRRKGD